MSELKKLKAKRTSLFNQLERLKEFVISYTDSSASQLPERIKRGEELWDLFDTVQFDIETSDKSDIQVNERVRFEDIYFNVISQAKSLIPTHVADVTNTANSDLLTDQSFQNSNNIKLPAIELPKFGGSYEDWWQFYETFNSLVHSNQTLNDIQRFYYLKSYLKDEAADVIHSLEVTSSNYMVAWNLLRERFENKRLIIHSHVRSLFELSPLDKESVTGLKRMLNDIRKNLRALKALKQPTDQWGTLLIHLISAKLDATTKREWESHSLTIKTDLADMNDFLSFLSDRCQLLETLESKLDKIDTKQGNKPRISIKSGGHAMVANINQLICTFCKGNHTINNCESFLSKPVSTRINDIKALHLCLNCLRSNHSLENCRAGTCKKCGRRHNTLLHIERQLQSGSSSNDRSDHNHHTNRSNSQHNTQNRSGSSRGIESYTSQQNQITISGYENNGDREVLLSTAIVDIMDSAGKYHKARALLDSGSQSCFISSSLADKLQLQRTPVNVPVSGINQISTFITNRVSAIIQSRFNNFSVKQSFLVLDNITNHIPSVSFSKSRFEIPNNIQLADENFNIASTVDLLLGAEVFYELLCEGRINSKPNSPIWQKTKLGWIVAGSIPERQGNKIICNLATNDINKEIQSQLQKFWEIENYPERTTSYTKEEQYCEDLFSETTERNCKGHFIVELPFNHKKHDLGESKEIALKRFSQIEGRFKTNSEFQEQYHNFMKEYEDLGHMSLIDQEDDENLNFIPHHAVQKDTNKFRIVFDGSAKTSNGISLNDILMVGPKVQRDLFDIILRFRQYKFVLTADIVKMYRQVYVKPEHRKFQCIVWRYNKSDQIQTYKLNTVTYGTGSAPFLAVRSLHQLGIENEVKYPTASNIIKNDFYVDDVLTGSNSLLELSQTKQELEQILQSGGFTLSKWKSNHSSLIEEHDTGEKTISDKIQKTLGIIWDATSDTLQYSFNQTNTNNRITKRTILSMVSKIYDPMGLIGPVTARAKSFLQQLWLLSLSWDDEIPATLNQEWSHYSTQLCEITNIKIHRQTICSNPVKIELHGFSDASEKIYRATIYIRSTNQTGQHTVNLISAKSKVAPIKTLTIPRLELCGALILSRLMQSVLNCLSVHIDKIYYWTDSSIVLAWLELEPCNLQVFVANRIREIQEITENTKGVWNHVSTECNPADIISRGATPYELSHSELWWYGPKWLRENFDTWPSTHTQLATEEIPDKKKSSIVCFSKQLDTTLLTRFSSLMKLQRVTAYIFRFKHNISKTTIKLTGELTVAELQNSLWFLLKLVQQECFAAELHALQNGRCIPKQSKLLSLNPFLDNNNIIRVGGRLKHAKDIIYEQRHPIILPGKHHFTKLIIRHEHYKMLHAGTQTLLATIRTRYWPLSAKNTIKGILRTCIVCFKQKANNVTPIMGNLPIHRVTPSRPFQNCGVDYAGPFNIKLHKYRGNRTVKGYLCIFICFSTKACHLELVSDLSSECFLNCLKRFISRRGKPTNIYSDNGTNFVGAQNNLQEFFNFIKSRPVHTSYTDYLTSEFVQWHFIPARSPHFGGLWEAAVRTAKYYIKRVLGNLNLTFEDFSTITCQIEACMNSRPIHPLSNDPCDFSALTPGHFLIGSPLSSLPESDLRDTPTNRLSKYQQFAQVLQHFWTRWSKEYISTLQERGKWRINQNHQLSIGSLVLLKEDNLPPLRWRLGRIALLHPGSDGVVRVVTVRTSSGEVKRSVTKVCVLPVEEDGREL